MEDGALPGIGTPVDVLGRRAWNRRCGTSTETLLRGEVLFQDPGQGLADEFAAVGDPGVSLSRMAGHAADHAPSPEHGQRHLVDIAHLRQLPTGRA
jgi:hypothetical protein